MKIISDGKSLIINREKAIECLRGTRSKLLGKFGKAQIYLKRFGCKVENAVFCISLLRRSRIMKVSEPAVAYNSPYLQGLKNRLIASIDTTTDEIKLQECLELLHEDSMPGVYTDEEFAIELRLSEASGNATKEEVAAFFKRWGH